MHAYECSVAFCVLHRARVAFLRHPGPEIRGTERTACDRHPDSAHGNTSVFFLNDGQKP